MPLGPVHFFFLILAFVKRWAKPLGPVFFFDLSYLEGYTPGFGGREKGPLSGGTGHGASVELTCAAGPMVLLAKLP